MSVELLPESKKESQIYYLIKDLGRYGLDQNTLTQYEEKLKLAKDNVFDLRDHLDLIRNSTSMDEKKIALKSLRKQSLEQKMNFSNLELEFVEYITNSNPKQDEIIDKFVNLSCKYNLNYNQERSFFKVVENLIEIQKQTKQTLDQTKEPEKFVKNLYKFEPVGKVEITQRTLGFYIKFYDDADYRRAYGGESNSEIPEFFASNNDEKMAGIVFKVGYKFLVGNHSLDHFKDPYAVDQLVRHEEEHFLQDMLETINPYKGEIIIDNDLNSEEIKETISAQLFFIRGQSWKRAKQEILAYYQSGIPIEILKRFMLNNPNFSNVYAFFHRFEVTKQSLETAILSLPEELKSEIKIFGDQSIDKIQESYMQVFENGLDCIQKLEEMNYSREKIVSLLRQTEHPIWRWGRFYSQIAANYDIKQSQ